jgi:hypothetical protein
MICAMKKTDSGQLLGNIIRFAIINYPDTCQIVIHATRLAVVQSVIISADVSISFQKKRESLWRLTL